MEPGAQGCAGLRPAVAVAGAAGQRDVAHEVAVRRLLPVDARDAEEPRRAVAVDRAGIVVLPLARARAITTASGLRS